MPQSERPSAQHASIPPHRIPRQSDRPSNRHYSGRGWSRTPRIVAMATVGVLVLGGTAAFAVYQQLSAEVEVSDVNDIVLAEGAVKEPKDPNDPFKDTPVNILVMGTDYRDAENVELAGGADEVGMRSDTTMLVHISEDRSWIHVVSIPRDSMVYRPACNLPDGGQSPVYEIGQFNGSFDAGGSLTGEGEDDLRYGAACTITTIMENTGIPMPNHIVVKMNGVLDVVDAIGGVRICLPEPVLGDPQYSDLDLPAGEQVLGGKTSLEYLRARHLVGLGDGSDTQRIDRQQGFINAMLRQILSADTLANPSKMLGLAKAVLGSVSPDPDLGDPSKLVGLAFGLKDIQPNRITFTTVPNGPWVQNPNRLAWTQPDADELWADITNDVPPEDLPPLQGEEPSGDASGTTGSDDDAPDEGDGGADDDTTPDDDGGPAPGDTGTVETAEPDGATAASPSPDPSPSQPVGTC